MKKIFFIACMFTCVVKVHAQQIDEYKKMIDSAIFIKYTLLLETNKKQNDEYYRENLYLLNEQNQPLNYVQSSGKFKLINVYDDRNRKIISKGIYAWKVFTSLNKNKFVITIIDFYITYKKHDYNFSNGGGSETIFEYNCGKNEWKLISSKDNGN